MRSTTSLTSALATGSLLLSTTAFALSPPNPTADIAWDVDPDTPGNQSSAPGISAQSVEAIEAAFTNARRQEEIQHNVTTNALGALNLPAQSIWDVMTAAERALMITNAERTARDGVNYPGHGTVLGLPLEGVESHLNKMAEDYAEYMAANNFWAHNVPVSISAPTFAGTGSFTRISTHPIIGVGAGTAGANCHQFLPFAENLHISASSVMNLPTPKILIENALYGWLYDDASSAWGHRVAMLLQDQTLGGGSGFNNDRGSAASEGFMGIGFAGRGDGSYSFFNGTTFPSQFSVVWVVMDPSADAACNFGVSVNKQLPNNSWRMISLPATPPASANTVANILGDDINGTYLSDWRVWMYDESIGASGDYVDPGINGVMVPGEAYWVIQATGGTVTLDMPVGSERTPVTTSARCAATAPRGCQARTLIAKSTDQWNMVGNPFYTRPSISNLRVSTSSGECADTNGCSITEAADQTAANVQHNQFWTYNGSGYDVFGPGDSMEPWQGYWNPVLPGANAINPVLYIPRH